MKALTTTEKQQENEIKTQRIKLTQRELNNRVTEHLWATSGRLKSTQEDQFKKLDLSEFTQDGITSFYDCTELTFPKHISYEGVNFTGCVLKNAVLTGCNLDKTIFNNCDLSNTDYSNTSLQNAKIENSTLTSTNLTGAKLIGATLKNNSCFNIIAPETTFYSAQISHCSFLRGNFSNAYMRNAIIQDSSFKDATCAGMQCQGATFVNIPDLKEINLQKIIPVKKKTDKSIWHPLTGPSMLGNYDEEDEVSFAEYQQQLVEAYPLNNTLLLNTPITVAQCRYLSDDSDYSRIQTIGHPDFPALLIDKQTLFKMGIISSISGREPPFFMIEKIDQHSGGISHLYKPCFWLTPFENTHSFINEKAFCNKDETPLENRKIALNDYVNANLSSRWTHFPLFRSLGIGPFPQNVPLECSFTETTTKIEEYTYKFILLTNSGYKSVITCLNNSRTPHFENDKNNVLNYLLHQHIYIETNRHADTITAYWRENDWIEKDAITKDAFIPDDTWINKNIKKQTIQLTSHFAGHAISSETSNVEGYYKQITQKRFVDMTAALFSCKPVCALTSQKINDLESAPKLQKTDNRFFFK